MLLRPFFFLYGQNIYMAHFVACLILRTNPSEASAYTYPSRIPSTSRHQCYQDSWAYLSRSYIWEHTA